MADETRNDSVSDLKELSIRVPPGRVAGLRQTHLRVAAVLATAVVGVALVVGLGIDFGGRAPGGREAEPPRGDLRPLKLNDLPGSYDQLPAPPQPPPPREPAAPDGVDPSEALLRQNEELRQNLARLADAVKQIGDENKRLLGELAKHEGEAAKEQGRVWASGLFFKIDERADAAAGPAANDREQPDRSAELIRADIPPALASAVPAQPPTDQERKRAFLDQRQAQDSHLNAPYLRPRSECELQAGTVIPAALLTGINTDLPGDVIATVTRPVYDSRTGKHLLIPQGAKLYGTYDSEIANGQNRALLVWHRLLMPNGRSIQLDGMKGTDAAGYAGVADKVDYHVDKLAVGVGLSSVIAYAGNLARGGRSNGDDARDVVGDTVAQEASRIGSTIIDRQLDVQPTITVRPGWPVRVLVDRDILLAPYQD